MADDLSIFEAVATALEQAHEPDLSAFDPSHVRAALGRVLGSPGLRRSFLAWLDTRVQTLSAGRVSIEERPIDPPPDEGGNNERQALRTGLDPARELPVRIVTKGEPFAEPAVVRANYPFVKFLMRG